MRTTTKKLIATLASQCVHLPQPVHLLAMCSGGIPVAEHMHRFLKSKGIQSSVFEVWTNTVEGKRTIWKTTFKKSDYTGTAIIVEDVIWKGGAIRPTKKMLHQMKKKKVYVASLLDCNYKGDFSVFN